MRFWSEVGSWKLEVGTSAAHGDGEPDRRQSLLYMYLVPQVEYFKVLWKH